MAQPVIPSTCPSIHHPSNMLRLGTPLSAAFIPLVPDASRGRSGVFSQTFTPEQRKRARGGNNLCDATM